MYPKDDKAGFEGELQEGKCAFGGNNKDWGKVQRVREESPRRVTWIVAHPKRTSGNSETPRRTHQKIISRIEEISGRGGRGSVHCESCREVGQSGS